MTRPIDPIDPTDAAALRAEADRRWAKRRGELEPKPAPLDPIAEARHWKDEQRNARKVFVALGCRVYWLSQARRTGQTPGLGDLWVFVPKLGLAFWWETKHGRGDLSTAQQEFRDLCAACGIRYACGTAKDAEDYAITLGLATRDAATGGLEPVRLTTTDAAAAA